MASLDRDFSRIARQMGWARVQQGSPSKVCTILENLGRRRKPTEELLPGPPMDEGPMSRAAAAKML